MPDASNTRRWLQFRLRTLLIALTIVAAILGVVVEPVSKQRRAVAAVMQAGGTVMYDWHTSLDETKWFGERKPTMARRAVRHRREKVGLVSLGPPYGLRFAPAPRVMERHGVRSLQTA